MRLTPRSMIGCSAAGLVFLSAVASHADSRVAAAVQHRDKAAVRALLQQKGDVNAPQPDGATALHWAVHYDDVQTAALLIKAGAKVNAINDYGVTPLLLACTNGSPRVLKMLLAAGADPNLALPTGETPLMTAARTGRVEAVNLLLARGADVNAAESERGQTALMWALAEQHEPVVKALVEGGANIHARTKSVAATPGGMYGGGSVAQGGFTPLMFAARWGNLDAARLLLAKGAKVNEADEAGLSVLMVAVLRGHAALAEFFLDHGADPNWDKAGYTALHWASGKWESSMTHDFPDAMEGEWRYLGGVPAGKIALIKALLAHGAQVNARITKNPPRYGINLFNNIRLAGATPFFLAALSADVEVMRLLAANGADPNLLSNDNVTPLMVASGLGRVSGDSLINDADSVVAAKLCVELGNDVNAVVPGSGDTALHGTAMYGNDQVAQFLVSQGANMNIKNKKGQTALNVADGYIINAMVLTRPMVAAVLRKLGATNN